MGKNIIKEDKATFAATLFVIFGCFNVCVEILVYFDLTSPELASVIFLMIFIILFFKIMQKYGIDWRSIKLRWFKNVRETLIKSIFIGWVLIGLFSIILYTTGYLGGYIKTLHRLLTPSTVIFYSLSVIIQETFSRGYMFQVIENLFLKKHSLTFQIFVYSLIFSLSHEIWGLPVMILSFFGNTILQLIYNSQKNLLGVTIVHLLGGLFIFPFIKDALPQW